MTSRNLVFGLFALLLLASCSDDEPGPELSSETLLVITAPITGASFVLTEATASDTMTTFTWSATNLDLTTTVAYTVEFDFAGNNFADPKTLGSVNVLALSITEGGMNEILLANGVEGGDTVLLDVRVKAAVNSDSSGTAYSEPISIEVTTYESFIVYPALQVPGSYQGWDPANETTVIYSAGLNDSYEGFVYVAPPSGSFHLHKFTQGYSWDTNWGDNDYDGTLELSAANMILSGGGVYRFNVNLGSLAYSSLLTNWGLIGSATPNGWDGDQDMSYDATNNRLTITLDLVPGEIKFRANDAWDVNFGDDGANGKLEYGGANIAIGEGGNYTITLDIFNTAVYTYTVTKN